MVMHYGETWATAQFFIGYCVEWGGTTVQPPLVSLIRVAVADWMAVSAAIFGNALIDLGAVAQPGMPSTS